MNPEISANLNSIGILPELVLSAFGILIMLIDPFVEPTKSRKWLGWLGFIGAAAAFASCFCQAAQVHAHRLDFCFYNMIRVDGFSIFFHLLICALAAIAILASLEYLDVQQIKGGEYYGLILFAAVGMVLMSSAVELVMVF